MRHAATPHASILSWLAALLIGLATCVPSWAGEPDPKTYWDVKDSGRG